MEAIRALEVPPGADYEVIVVDNGSADETAEVCRSLESSFAGRLRRVFLPVPGLSRAGNAGFAVARGELIGFLDDDVLPRPDWLGVVCQEFSADPSLGAISGRAELLNPEDLPISIRRHTERVEFRSLGDAYCVFTGCNLVVRRVLVERVGLFDPDIGTGSRFGSAGDTDFFYRAWKAGAKLVYVPSLFVHHDHGRCTPEAKLKLARDYVVGRGAFYAKHVLGRDGQAAREMYWEMTKGLADLFHPADELGWRFLAWLLKGFLGYCLLRCSRYVKASLGGRALSALMKKNPIAS